ncbi:MAG TPA: hypothetical protein VKX46_11380 [Ktedonobacteraceae bacterium]|nr:hypothetical protein [Ktedonobacteraceae bacterium]
MVKIHIIGAPGSGKTTLAQELVSRLHIPHYDLDKINLEEEGPVTLAARPAWVTEGIYLITTEPMLYHADHIVLLEISWPVAAWRVIRRHISNSLHGRQQYPGLNGIKLLFKLVYDMRRYLLNLDEAGVSSAASLQAYREAHRNISAPPTVEFMQMYIEAYGDLIAPPSERFVRAYLAAYKDKVFVVRNGADRERLLELLTRK